MKIQNLSTLIVLAIVFNSCGNNTGGEDNMPDNNSSVIESPLVIDTYEERGKLSDTMYKVCTKTEYETMSEYDKRVQEYIDTNGTFFILVDISDKYDAETQTLKLWDYHFSSDVDNHDFYVGYGRNNNDKLQVINSNLDNITDYPFFINHSDNEIIFYEYSLSSSSAEELDGTFKMLYEITLETRGINNILGYKRLFDSNYIFSSETNYLTLHANLKSIKIYSTKNPTNTIFEYSIN